MNDIVPGDSIIGIAQNPQVIDFNNYIIVLLLRYPQKYPHCLHESFQPPPKILLAFSHKMNISMEVVNTAEESHALH